MSTESLSILLNARADGLVPFMLSCDVELIVVGGVALAYHGIRDMMQVDDVDVLLNPTPENASRAHAALLRLGIGPRFEPARLESTAVQVQLKDYRYWADLITPPLGAVFAHLNESTVMVELGSRPVPVAGIPALLALKRLAVQKLRGPADPRDDTEHRSAELRKHEADLAILEERCSTGSST